LVRAVRAASRLDRAAPASRAPGPPIHLRPGAVALVMVGGGAGAAARQALEAAVKSPHGFPLATLIANLAGAFLLGVLLEALVRGGADSGWRRRARLLAATGFIGAFTTYSTFAVETDQLVRAGRWATAAAYLVATVLGGLVVAGAGIAAPDLLGRRRPAASLPIDPDVDRERPVQT
jgi:CrcB protein